MATSMPSNHCEASKQSAVLDAKVVFVRPGKYHQQASADDSSYKSINHASYCKDTDDDNLSSSPSCSGDEAFDEKSSLIKRRKRGTGVYKRRWIVLILFCIGSSLQSLTWNSFGPVAPALPLILGWQESTVAILPGISNIGLVTTGTFFLLLIIWKDLRLCVVMASLSLFLGTVLELSGLLINAYTHLDKIWTTLTIYFGAYLNGMGASVFMSIPPFMSAVWFPLSERTTATAIGANSAYFGTALSFLIAPAFLGQEITANQTKHNESWPPNFVPDLRMGFLYSFYFYTGITALSLFFFLVYFPAAPPLPPTSTASKGRLKFWEGIKSLFSSGQYWLQNIAYNVPNGIYNSWLAIMSVNFSPLGIDDKTVGWIGFAAVLGGVAGGMIASRIADHFKTMLKAMVVVMTILALVCFVLMSLIFQKLLVFDLPVTIGILGVLSVLGGAFINGCTPIMYELTCETAYPVNESLTCLSICIINNFFGIIFLFLSLVPGIGNAWLAWAIVGGLAMSIPLLFLVKADYKRLHIDE